MTQYPKNESRKTALEEENVCLFQRLELTLHFTDLILLCLRTSWCVKSSRIMKFRLHMCQSRSEQHVRSHVQCSRICSALELGIECKSFQSVCPCLLLTDHELASVDSYIFGILKERNYIRPTLLTNKGMSYSNSNGSLLKNILHVSQKQHRKLSSVENVWSRSPKTMTTPYMSEGEGHFPSLETSEVGIYFPS